MADSERETAANGDDVRHGSAEQWERMWELFHQAVELAPEERGSFLDRSCAGDPGLRADVDKLLAGHDEAPSLLDPLSPTEEEPSDPLVGSRVGPYRIERAIGRGGMGTVYEASQQEPIHRQVALKLITLGMDTQEVVARFESERQALALMDHPHIATVHDAGSTDQGRPYFVMELVSGRAITGYCDAEQLTVNQRLELLIPVCKAVQHAHQKGIVHRDLKPSNILVTSQDGGPVAKIIDFGIAKAVRGRLTEKTLATVHGHVIGTPGYMSPEQEAEGSDVDTRADVYSLGVVLYELLVGRLPFEPKPTPPGASATPERSQRDSEPLTPSGRLGTLGADVAAVAKRRSTDAGSLRRALRGDLDWVVMRALEHDRDRRYATAAELAADLRRYLDHQPVVAGPPGAAYRARKFLQRHRLGAAAAASLTLALVLGTIGTSWMAVVASRERRAAEAARDQAQEEADIAHAVVRLLDDMLSAPDPADELRAGGTRREVKVVDVLDRATDALNGLDGQPAVEAALRLTLGKTYLNLGLADVAQVHFERALELNRGLHGEDHPDTLTSSHRLAQALTTRGRLEDAESLLREAFEGRSRVLGAEHPDTLVSALSLANLAFQRGRIDEAERLLRGLVPIQTRLFGDEDLGTLAARDSLAVVLSRKGEYSEAETIAREVLDIRRRVHGDDHYLTLVSLGNLAMVLEEEGALDEAEGHFRKLVNLNQRVLGGKHPSTLLSMQNLASVVTRLGRPGEAVPLYREVLAHYSDTLGSAHPSALVTAHNLARTLTDAGHAEEAVAIYRDAIARASDAIGSDHHLVATFEGGLGTAQMRLGRYAQAEAHLLASHRRLEEIFGPEHRRTETARQRLVELYEAWGRPQRAASYRDVSSATHGE